MDKRLGWLFALAATVAYSVNTPIARGAILEGMSPTTLLIARFSLGSLLLGITLGLTSVGRTGGSRPLDRFGLWMSIGSGLLNAFMITAFFTALETVSASIAALVAIALVQILTLGLLALRGESITQRSLIRLLIGLSGLFLLVGVGGSADPWGLALLFFGATLFSLHIVSVQWFLKPYNTWIVTTIIVASATIAIFFFWLISGSDLYVPAPIGWIAIFVQGVIATFIGRILTYSAINIIGSAQFALLAPLETTLTIVWAAIFLGERLSSVQWLGTFIILISTVLAADAVWHALQRMLPARTPAHEGSHD